MGYCERESGEMPERLRPLYTGKQMGKVIAYLCEKAESAVGRYEVTKMKQTVNAHRKYFPKSVSQETCLTVWECI